MKYTPLHTSSPFPLGASCQRNGNEYIWNFAVFSKEPLSFLVLQDIHRASPPLHLPLDRSINTSGDVWHMRITTQEKTLYWAWAKRQQPLSNDKGEILYIQDPFAKLLDTHNSWGKNRWIELKEKKAALPLGIAMDWDSLYSNHASHTESSKKDKKPSTIYEMHIRGFTQDPSSKVDFPGTFRGAIQKLHHLERMGVDAIELLPITEFDETECPFVNPLSHVRLHNYWGYSPLNYFAPCGRFFSSSNPLDWPNELKAFVDECHSRNIQVILDVVYNHTGEGNEQGPTYSWKGLAPDCYYMRSAQGEYLNFSGCGNTINANHPVVIDMIRESLRHWVQAYGIDGFRFDLAACLTRSQTGMPMSEPPLLEEIAQDPILGDKILIAEPWDAAGLYQTGALHSLNQTKTTHFLEWNDKFRDDVRRFLKGDRGFSGVFATRISGSQDLYSQAPSPHVSINYITAHDGFSLHDLVSYNAKHNIENGEHNNDGMTSNHSWNSGVEGETKESGCLSLRRRRMETMIISLFLSQGTPMLLMGDEYGHTKRGNNNAWCHDSPLNWFNWHHIEHTQGFIPLIQTLIHLRKETGLFQRERFLSPSDVEWHGKKAYAPDWSWESQFVAFSLMDHIGHPLLYSAFSAESHETTIELPSPPPGKKWHLIASPGIVGPRSYYSIEEAPSIESHFVKLQSYSSIIFYAKKRK